jgi:hypothetical protein
MASFTHYHNKTQLNNIPISIIEEIKADIISGKYKILNLQHITNIQLLHQGVNEHMKSKNKYCFIVKNDAKTCLVNIELHKENNEYISKYKSQRYLSGYEIRLYFFYFKYVVNTFLGMSFLSTKTIGVIALISGISTFTLGFIYVSWESYVEHTFPCWLYLLLNMEC